MTFLLTQLQQATLVFLLLLLLGALINWRALRRPERYPAPDKPLPFLSILVPARNEEQNIRACLCSLLEQDYPGCEVLVLDDGSTDATPSILEELRQTYPTLKVLQGAPLPAGWYGKPWACHQLAGAAQGELLFFTDADTIHRPAALRRAVTALLAEKADFLSAIPAQEMRSWGEILTVPIMAWSLFAFLPLPLAYRLNWPPLSAAIGQFLLFRLPMYARLGGHASVRTTSAEDLAFARRVLSAGGRWRLLDGAPLTSCRMYSGYTPALRGLSKSMLAAFDYQFQFFLPIWLWVGWVFLSPLVLMLAAWSGVLPASLPLAALTLALEAALWALFCLRLGYPLRLTLLFPVVIFNALLIASHSSLAYLSGQAEWKGRSLPRSRPLPPL